MAAPIEEVLSPSKTNSIKILKWKVKKGSMLSKGSVLALYIEEEDENKKLKWKTSVNGTVTEILVDENCTAKPG